MQREDTHGRTAHCVHRAALFRIRASSVDRTKLHKLLDIVVMAICAVICGADGWVEVEAFGHAKHKWLKTFLELPNGIPSHDTFGRVLGVLDPDQFQSCFLSWITAVSQVTQGQVIAIDGKTLRRSHDKALGKKGHCHGQRLGHGQSSRAGTGESRRQVQ